MQLFNLNGSTALVAKPVFVAWLENAPRQAAGKTLRN